jgi:aryl carrier-like protein
MRPVQVRLLGGLVLFLSTLYCGPRFDPKNKSGNGRGQEGAGLYPELGVLGILKGVTPALVYEVGRLAASSASYEAVQHELRERGIELDIKEVYAIAKLAQEWSLTYRRRELEQFRQGKLPPGQGKGKRIAAMIDGGRTKIRRTTRHQKGKGKNKQQKRRYKSEWREPKLLIVFELDEQGKMKAGTKPIIDGTFSGPDEAMEILVLRLYQMGATEAKKVVFRADGACWIWERTAWVKQRLGLHDGQWSEGLDSYHGAHHIGIVLGLLPLEEKERKRLYKKLRKWLFKGQWRKVSKELEHLQGQHGSEANAKEVATELEYLRKHGEAGRLDYAKFRRRKLPLGSGAIESGIRRVINLRMKGNSISWKEENAEGMLMLRGMVLSRRWKGEHKKITQSMVRDRRTDWEIRSPDMPSQLKSEEGVKAVKSQLLENKVGYDTAA